MVGGVVMIIAINKDRHGALKVPINEEQVTPALYIFKSIENSKALLTTTSLIEKHCQC